MAKKSFECLPHSLALRVKACNSASLLKYSEFDHLEIRVIHDFPCSEKFKCRAGAQQIFNYIGGAGHIRSGLCHIGEADIVPLVKAHNCHGGILHCDQRGFLANLFVSLAHILYNPCTLHGIRVHFPFPRHGNTGFSSSF